MKIINTKRVVQETTRIGNSNRTVTLPKKITAGKRIGQPVIKNSITQLNRTTKPCLGCRRKRNNAI